MSTKSFVQKKLSECTDRELLAFAKQILNIPKPDAANILEQVKAAWPQEFILVAQDAPPVAEPRAALAGANHILTKEEIEARAGAGISAQTSMFDPICDIVIPEGEGQDGKENVFVNVNGNAMMIARGVPQAVPWRYMVVLQNAVQRLYNQDEKTFEITYRDVPRFSFSPVPGGRWPSQREIDEWNKRGGEPARKAA